MTNYTLTTKSAVITENGYLEKKPITTENKLYDVLLTQYFRFKVAAPDLETAEELATESVLWDDYFSDLHFEFDRNEHDDLETADSTYKPETEENSQ